MSQGRKTPFTADMEQRLLDLLLAGETLTAISKHADMPSLDTIQRWEAAQDERGKAITRARELGYTARAEAALVRAQTADDPAKGRLSFDADRWFLGKMHPKKFGDKTLVGSDPDNPLPTATLDLSRLSKAALDELAALDPDA